jgi:C1A family cysteine protease
MKVATASLLVSVAAGEMSWQEYKDTYGLAFNGNDEDEFRRGVFEGHVQFITAENQKDHTYELGVNPFTHWTSEEFHAYLTGEIGGDEEINADVPLLEEEPSLENTVTALDWRTQGVLNGIKNQGHCGSCWAFSAIAGIESNWAVKTGQLKNLAEQQLVDCSSAGTCDGGHKDRAMDYGATHGFYTTASYPYTGKDGTCKTGTVGLSAGKVLGHMFGYKTEAGLVAMLNHGPTSVSVDADDQHWSYYSKGIVSASCSGSTNHAVLAVAYDSTSFTIRNSWGTSWGESGHIRLARGVGGYGSSCVLLKPVRPAIATSPAPAPSTTCKTKSGKGCVFPFNYHDKNYNSCTTVDNSGTSWCSTKTADGDYIYGYYGACGSGCAFDEYEMDAETETMV